MSSHGTAVLDEDKSATVGYPPSHSHDGSDIWPSILLVNGDWIPWKLGIDLDYLLGETRSRSAIVSA